MGEIKADKIQWGIGYDQGRLYEVTRAFMMETFDGPLVTAKAGEVVFLSPQIGDELFFSGKVIPVELAELYEVVKDFRVEKNGEYVRVAKGDILKLSRDEAVQFLRSGDVKPKKGGIEK